MWQDASIDETHPLGSSLRSVGDSDQQKHAAESGLAALSRSHLMAVINQTRPVQGRKGLLHAEKRRWRLVLWAVLPTIPLQLGMLVTGPCKLLQPDLRSTMRFRITTEALANRVLKYYRAS